jgi:hypothetical protein
MKPTYVGVLVASLYIIFKMVLFFAGIQHTFLEKTPWIPLLILVQIGIFYAINQHIRTNCTYDWMALIASVICGIFIYIYYSAIDTDYLQLRQIEAYNKFKGQIPKEQMAESEKSLKAAFRPTTFSIVTVSAINILGLIGSLAVALIGRFTIKRN